MFDCVVCQSQIVSKSTVAFYSLLENDLYNFKFNKWRTSSFNFVQV